MWHPRVPTYLIDQVFSVMKKADRRHLSNPDQAPGTDAGAQVERIASGLIPAVRAGLQRPLAVPNAAFIAD